MSARTAGRRTSKPFARRSDDRRRHHTREKPSGKRALAITSAFDPEHVARLREIAECSDSRVPPDFVARCDSFLRELSKWNKRVNLISRWDEARVVERHVLDSLCLLSFDNRLEGKRILDVGSGAGFPGMVLALWESRAHVMLLESKSKPVTFLRAVRRNQAVHNAEVVHARLETILQSSYCVASVDIVTSRALGKPLILARNAIPILKPGGAVVFYCAKRSSDHVKKPLALAYPELEVRLITPAWQTRTTLLILRKLG